MTKKLIEKKLNLDRSEVGKASYDIFRDGVQFGALEAIRRQIDKSILVEIVSPVAEDSIAVPTLDAIARVIEPNARLKSAISGGMLSYRRYSVS